MPPSVPETRYAKSGDVNIAFQVVGDGAFDLIWVPGWVSNVEASWEVPEYAHFLGRLASFSRLILFDKRGTGLSDPVAVDRLPSLEQRMDDVRAVLDAAGSERAALFGASEGGNLSVLFAATYPARVRALVLLGAFAKRVWSADYPWAPTLEDQERRSRDTQRSWGSPEIVAPLAAGSSSEQLQRFATFFRRSASPGAAVALRRMNAEIDTRAVLPVISVPTLVLHRTGDTRVKPEEGRWIAKRIPDAKYVEVPGDDHLAWAGDVDPVLDEVEEFLTGTRRGPEPDRVLATVLFTDIVGSTAKAGELGDREWNRLLQRHHDVVRSVLERFRGHEVGTAGDGFLATFDGPGRAVRAALAARDAVRPLGIEIRAGVHTGEIELVGADVAGIAVHTGSRVAALAGAGEVLVSSTVKDLVAGSGIEFEERGEYELKGVPGTWRLYAVTSA